MPTFVRMRVFVILAGLVPLVGCVGDRPNLPPVVVDTRMPVIVDYRAHRPLHPPPKRDQGRVDPEPIGEGRENDFGPESRLVPSDIRTKLSAVLERFRASEPGHGHDLLGLARKKPRLRAAKLDADKVDPDRVDADAPDAASPDPDGASDRPRGPAERRQAKLDADAVKDVDGGYRLNFEDAEIKDVLQAVLGNTLGLSYTIAPNVTGRITISSAAPQNRGELLSTLESVLALQGLAMTRSGSSYRVAPVAIGGGTVDTNGKEPGFGITVVPLEFSSAASVMKLIGGFLTDADGVRVDTARNAVIVRGPAPRREEIVRAIKNFDADWMHQQSVSVVELRRSKPDEIISELTRVFDTDSQNGSAAGVVQFKAIKRLRSIMVISRNPQLVKRATNWIHRLDHADTSATQGVYIYRPRYREARELVRLVNGLFGSGNGGNGGGGGAGVSYQDNSLAGQDQPRLDTTPQNRSLGQSSASFAGGLSSGGFGSGGGASGGMSSGGGGGGLGGSSGGTFGAGGGSSAGGAGAAGGNGQPGNLADPIEAGRGDSGGGDRSKLSLTADTGNNTIVAYTDGDTYRKVHSVLTQLDLPPLQVAVNVIVAEVELNDELKYGVQFYLNNKAGSVGLSQTASQVLQTGASAATGLPGFNLANGVSAPAGFNFLAGNTQSANVILSALDSISKVHILSTPSVVVMENKAATFEVGNQVPVVTQQATSTVTADAPTLNQVQYLDTGIILKIIPRVGQKGEVDMDLDQIISAVVPDASGNSTLTPTISKRRVASNISVTSGQSVMLAGLIDDHRQKSKGQVPFIGPDLGNIFGNTDNAFSRTELMIFIRPVIIRSGQDAQAVTEEFRGNLRAMDLRGGGHPVYKP